ncbi:L,D-transpeptidase family protein [Pseudooceanicola sp. 216_PA32_1]|uniref:L,D-transpeptidase family protein n=1 Tax=Pseudooceanicola pacificus TaxID=2676438 RepID=A0A844VYW5_9RHOB|nr:L,D-transpeptidase family protein [Pseudooceanicola pacificus]MWB76577.1 L,D-transpeptidase family protein [Pseudooceanicola pacificus]
MSPFDLVLTPRGVRFMGRLFPCTIGRGGIRADKREGDGATPVGRHRVVGMLYRPDRMARPADWAEPIGPGDLWSDDPRDAAYNLMVRAPYAPSHEALRRADPMYDIVLLTDWNWPEAQPGRGSAIFLHQWRRPGAPTAGCIAFRRDHLRWIAGRIQPGAGVIVPAPGLAALA